MDTWTYYHFAANALYVLPVISGVALIAFLFQRRSIFYVGLIGCLIGWSMTGVILPTGHSTGGAIDNLSVQAECIRANTILFSILGVAIMLAVIGIERLLSQFTR
jgi:hypothetical protein